MLSTSEALALKLNQVMKEQRLSGVAVAKQCGVTKQAVQGWKSTGRIDKKHLSALAELTKRPLEWWLDLEPEPVHRDSTGDATHSIQEREARYRVARWPFATVNQSEYEQLAAPQRDMVEGFVRGLIAENSRNKRAA